VMTGGVFLLVAKGLVAGRCFLLTLVMSVLITDL